MTKKVASEAQPGNLSDVDYAGFLNYLNAKFQARAVDEPLFTTDARDRLWGLYLRSFDGDMRQHHNCTACRHFIERFGHLATIGEDGMLRSPIWEEVDDPLYELAATKMAVAVRKAKVTGVFLSGIEVLGTPQTDEWRHLSLRLPATSVFRNAVLNSAQAMAEKAEDFRAVGRALGELSAGTMATAVELLESESMYRTEKVLGPAKWLRDVQLRMRPRRGKARQNVLWRAVATAPAGFCHPRSSMIWTLLEDIDAGLPFEQVSRRFAEKMNPTRYQRPQAPPRAGAIVQAEKIVEQLKAAGSFRRRFAVLEDVVCAVWRPPGPKNAGVGGGGVFAKVKPRGAVGGNMMRIPTKAITWIKLERDVLPTALRIEFKAPSYGNYVALVTAEDPASPPILQWDREDARNPVSWYVYAKGSTSSQFCLDAGTYYEVPAVTLKPSMWNGGSEHQGDGVIFLMDGAKDGRGGGNSGLFPEILRSELHGVRSVIESYSRETPLGGGSEQACGIMLQKGGDKSDLEIRVHTESSVSHYLLDRWE